MADGNLFDKKCFGEALSVVNVTKSRKKGRKTMEQEKNKVPSQDNENPGSEKFQRAQELYERSFISNAEADFEEMITVLDSIYKNRVKSELREKGCCDKENYEDAMQEARQGIWTRIKKLGNFIRSSANIVAGFILIKQWILQRKKTHMNKR